MSLAGAKADPKWFPRQAGPEFVFHPNIIHSTDSRYQGATETALAFARSDEWGRAVAASDIIGAYGVVAAQDDPNGEDGYLLNLCRMANDYRKGILLEVGGPYGTVGVETGALSAAWDIANPIANVVSSGGAVTHIVMDHPIRRVIDNLGQTLAQACDQIVEYMQTLHATYPAIKISMVDQPTYYEYLGKPRYNDGVYGVDYATAWDTLMAKVVIAGEVFDCLSLDISGDYQNAIAAPLASAQKDSENWTTRLKAMQQAAVDDGVKTGIGMYSTMGGGHTTGTFPDPVYVGSNERFQQRTGWYAEQIRELIQRGKLLAFDRVHVQSFNYYPRAPWGPETTPNTFCETFLQTKAIYLSA
jgi:hypothetical protein